MGQEQKQVGFLDLVQAKVAPRPRQVAASRREAKVEPPALVRAFVEPSVVKLRTDPCAKCPARGQSQVLPAVPDSARFVCVSSLPSDGDVRAGHALPRQVLDRALGLDESQVGWACAVRCEPPGGAEERRAMYRNCAKHLLGERRGGEWARDGDVPPGTPVLAVGDEAVYSLMESRDHDATYHRGLWRRAPSGRRVFALLAGDYPRLRDDAARFVRTLDSAGPELRDLRVVTDPRREPDLMRWLAGHPGPWAFDIESFDAGAYPSRREVATDACHPDYRVRGVAVAWSEDEGAWLELAPLGQDAWRPWLDPVFGSPALKVAHNGHTDHEGLVYNGWVTGVVNRGGDSMLEWLALSDGRHAGVSLERLSVDVLGQDQWWEAFEKSRMRDAPLDLVARSAVFDAGYSLWLHVYARDRMLDESYWDGS